MRCKSILFPVALCVMTVVALGREAGAQTGQYEQDHVVVRFSDPAIPGIVDSLLGSFGVLPEVSLIDSTTYLVALPTNLTVEVAIASFIQQPAVVHAGPNYFCRIVEGAQMSQAVLDEDSEAYAAGVSPGGFYSQVAVGQVRANESHTIATGSGILVAHIDNGIDPAHALFAGRLSPAGYDFVDNDSDPTYTPGPNEGHGTFGAGLLLLSAPDIRILPVRCLDSDGTGTMFAAILGIEYALEQGADVIVLGLGMYVDDLVMKSTIRRADSAGVLIIAAGGNDDQDLPLRYPAAYPEVLGVGAVDSNDVKASFSNFGASVDLCAPGTALYSALPGADSWGTWSGTSFATPLVAGLAVLTRQVHPDIPPCAIRDIIRWGCVAVDSLNPQFVGALGAGRIDMARSAGYDEPVVSLRGWTVDSTSTGLAGVELMPFENGLPVASSFSIANDTGFYVATVPAGTYNLVYTPPVGCSVQTTTLTAIVLTSDTVITTVMAPAQTQSSCTCEWQGDIDANGAIDAIDLGALIDVIFFGGSNPQDAFCPKSRGDFNADGFADAVDLGGAVDHVFFGGLPPADPCLP